MNFDNIYRKMEYAIFLAESEYNAAVIDNYAEECMCLESADMSNLILVNEAALDTLRAAVTKIITALAHMWNSFIDKCNEALNIDVQYLNDNKKYFTGEYSKFLRQPLSDVYPYWKATGLWSSIKVPQWELDDKMTKFNEVGENKDKEKFFLQTLMGSPFSWNDKVPGGLKSQIVFALQGGDKIETNMADLDMREIHGWCVNWKNNRAKLSDDKDLILQGQKKLEEALKTMGKDAPKAAEAKPAASTAEPEKKDASPTETKIDDNDKMQVEEEEPKPEVESAYSSVFKSYITELKVGEVEDDSKVQKTGHSGKANIAEPAGEKNSADNVSTASVASTTATLDGKSAKEIQAVSGAATLFFRYCCEIVAAKATANLAMHREYMQILRAHVNNHSESDTGATNKEGA